MFLRFGPVFSHSIAPPGAVSALPIDEEEGEEEEEEIGVWTCELLNSSHVVCGLSL